MNIVTSKLSRSLQLIIMATLLSAFAYGQQAPLSGSVINILGQPIPGVTLVIESDNSVRKVKTDNEGRFAAWGFDDAIYRIYTEDWVGKLNYTDDLYMPEGHASYFRPTHRGGIILGPKAGPAKIRMILIETAAVVAEYDAKTNVIASGNGLRYNPIAPHSKMKYHILMDYGQQIAHDLIIRYGVRVQSGNLNSINVYTTPISIDQPTIFGPVFPGVVITHDRTTVYCEKALYDRGRQTISVSGLVMVDDPKGVNKYRSGVINIAGKTPKFTFTK
ncbi:MAG: carboxypeptidase regulatory-like domain-containing protein [Blastocatellia bacterium]|nr:carboxypeptidase regulatory-like domain-containing protein [Blastocatellia bacterium]